MPTQNTLNAITAKVRACKNACVAILFLHIKIALRVKLLYALLVSRSPTMEERRLRRRIDESLEVLDGIQAKINRLWQKADVIRRAVNNDRATLKAYPSKLYWSQLSDKALPMEVVWKITSYHDIATKLYKDHRPSMKLMIHPMRLPVLHIQHCLASKALMKYHQSIHYWIKFNRYGTIEPRPRWTRGLTEPSLKDMAARFRSRTFRAGPVTLTTLSPNGILEFQTETPVTDKTLRIQGQPLEVNGTTVLAKYRDLPVYLEVQYGGRKHNRRLVMCRKAL